MQNIEIMIPSSLYSNYLETISNVKFSVREVDVLACIVSGKSVKGIAEFLSISPHTVETHTRNISRKIECGSRDGIIKFIEKSDKYLFLKQYYSRLLNLSDFEQTLSEISSLIKKRHLSCTIIHWQTKEEKFFLPQQFFDHLKKIGLAVSLEKRQGPLDLFALIKETHDVDYVFYCLPKEHEDFLVLYQEKIQIQANQLFLQTDKNDSNSFNKNVYYIEENNYYFSFLYILKRIFFVIDIDPIVENFEKKYKNKQENLDLSLFIKQKIQEEKQPFFFKSLWAMLSTAYGGIIHFNKMTLIFVMLLILFLGELGSSFLFYWNQKNNATHTFRSDLALPMESVFLNRSELITQIDAGLREKKGTQIVALVGIGGSGKTTLARQYAHEQKANVVWEINAETSGSLYGSFEKLARTLSKTEKDQKILREVIETKNLADKKEALISFVKGRLKLLSPWLLIFDNVEHFSDIQTYFPRDIQTWGQGKVILTTRNTNIQNSSLISSTITIDELTSEQKQALFTKIMNDEKAHTNGSREISTFLEYVPPFPLDVSVAAYYLKSTNIPYKQYVEKLRHYTKETNELQESILKEAGEYTKTRYAIITPSLENLINNRKDFADLLLFISLLDSQNIPKSLLDQYKNSNIVDNFIYHLKKHSLLTAEKSSSLELMYSIHRSTQEISLFYLLRQLKLNKGSPILKKISYVLDDHADKAIEQEDFPRMQIIARHIEKLLEQGVLTDFSKGLLESKLGSIYYLTNDEKTKQLIQDSASILNTELLKNLSPEDRLKLARSLLHIGAVYTELRLDKEAKEALEQAVSLYRKEGQRNYVNLSWALSYLGNIHRKLGNYEKARDYLEESIQLHKQHGTDQKRVSRTLAYLGSTYRGLGAYQKCIDTLNEALALYEKHYSSDHFRVGWILIQLGNVYRDLYEFQKAKKHIEDGLHIFQKHLPSNHVNLGLAFAYLGNCHRELGNYAKSRHYLEESVKIHQQHFNDQHVKMGWLLFHLANTYKALGQHQEAQQLLDKVLKIYTSSCGENNIEKARLLRTIAKIYLERNNLSMAEYFIAKSLKIFESYNHIESFKALRTLGEIMLKQSTQLSNINKIKESQILKSQALNNFKRALKITKQYFSEKSPPIQKIEKNIKQINKIK